MAGPDPAIHRARVCERKRIYWRVDTRQMDGRLKGGHDELVQFTGGISSFAM